MACLFGAGLARADGPLCDHDGSHGQRRHPRTHRTHPDRARPQPGRGRPGPPDGAARRRAGRARRRGPRAAPGGAPDRVRRRPRGPGRRRHPLPPRVRGGRLAAGRAGRDRVRHGDRARRAGGGAVGLPPLDELPVGGDHRLGPPGRGPGRAPAGAGPDRRPHDPGAVGDPAGQHAQGACRDGGRRRTPPRGLHEGARRRSGGRARGRGGRWVGWPHPAAPRGRSAGAGRGRGRVGARRRGGPRRSPWVPVRVLP